MTPSDGAALEAVVVNLNCFDAQCCGLRGVDRNSACPLDDSEPQYAAWRCNENGEVIYIESDYCERVDGFLS